MNEPTPLLFPLGHYLLVRRSESRLGGRRDTNTMFWTAKLGGDAGTGPGNVYPLWPLTGSCPSLPQASQTINGMKRGRGQVNAPPHPYSASRDG